MSSTPEILEDFAVLESRGARWRNTIQVMASKSAALGGRHQGFLTLCDQGVVSVTNFATGVVVGRVCGKAELGAYTLAWTLMALATGISATLTTTPYTVFGPRLGRRRRSRYLGSILVHQSVLSIVFVLAIVAGAVLGSWRGWLSDSIFRVMMTTAGVIMFFSLREFVRGVSFAELRIGWALSVDIIACLVQGTGMIVLLHFGALTASRTLALLGMSSASAAGAWLALHRGAFRPDARLFARDLARNWQFAKWVFGSGIVSQIARYMYPWMLVAFHGTAVTGIWAACTSVVAMGNPVLLGLGNYIFPKISNVYAISGIAAMKRYVHRSSLLFSVLLLPVVLVLAGFGEPILTGVYGKAYAGAAGILVLLAATLLVSSLANPFSQGLFTLECAKADTVVNVIWVALLFTLGIPAVKWYAAIGAAATLFVTTSATAAIRIGVFAREVRRRS